MYERRFYQLRIDDVKEDDYTFKGCASPFDVVDCYGTVAMRGSFKKTLKAKPKVPMLWSHCVYDPIGVIGGRESERGLEVDGEFNRDVQRAREIYSLTKQMKKAETPMGISIGFNILKERTNKDTGAREMLEIDLWEVSPCVFPANPEAYIEQVNAVMPPEARPYPNEHAARLRDPGDFSLGTIRRKSEGTIYGKIRIPETIDVIWGKLKGKDSPEDYPVPQALLFPTKAFTADEAKAWMKDNDVKYVEFEPAKRSIGAALESLSGLLIDNDRIGTNELTRLQCATKQIAERHAEAERLLRGAGGSEEERALDRFIEARRSEVAALRSQFGLN